MILLCLLGCALSLDVCSLICEYGVCICITLTVNPPPPRITPVMDGGRNLLAQELLSTQTSTLSYAPTFWEGALDQGVMTLV